MFCIIFTYCLFNSKYFLLQIRTGMVQVSDGKSRPRPARLVLTMDAVTIQREAPVPVQPTKEKNVPHARVSFTIYRGQILYYRLCDDEINVRQLILASQLFYAVFLNKFTNRVTKSRRVIIRLFFPCV